MGHAMRSDQDFLLQIVLDNFPGGISVMDGDLRIIYINQTACRILDFPDHLFAGGPPLLEELLRFNARRGEYGPGDVEQSVETRMALAKARKPHAFERQRPDGTTIEVRGAPAEGGGFVTTYMDITERKQADVLRNGQAQILQMIAMSASLENTLEHLMLLVESQLAGIFSSVLLLDKDGIHLRHGAAPSLAEAYVNAVDGVQIGPKAGSCGTAVHRREAVIVTDIMRDPLWEDYRELAAAHGYRSCWSTPILSHQGAVLGTFAMYSKTAREPTDAETCLVDVATRIAGIAIERKQTEDRIHFMATHDALTGLPNRTLLKDRLSQALLHARRYDKWMTIMFVDLDNFKTVNDRLGHNAGDELLKLVAFQMTNCVRATDTVVRLGGDEFVILLLDQPKSVDAIAATAQKIRAAIAETAHLEGHDLRVTSSIGIANYPNDGIDADALLANADAAMYRAKEMGRDNFQFYAPELNTEVRDHFSLQEEL